jgi:hypothetical protein
MQSRAVSFGWIVMLILGIFWLYLGIYKLIDPEIMIESWFETMGDQSWAAFVAANPEATVDFVQLLVISLGTTQLAIAAFVLIITLYGYRRGEKWAWYTLLVGNIILFASMLISGILNSMNLNMSVLGLVLLIIALAVPAKKILSQ